MTNNAFSRSFKEDNLVISDEAAHGNTKLSSNVLISLDDELK